MNYETRKSQFITGIDMKNFSLLKKYSERIETISNKKWLYTKEEKYVFVRLSEFMLDNAIYNNKFIFTDNLINHLLAVAKNSRDALISEKNKMEREFEDFFCVNNLENTIADFVLFTVDYNQMKKEYQISMKKIRNEQSQIEYFKSQGLIGIESFIDNLLDQSQAKLIYIDPKTLSLLEYFLAIYDAVNDYIHFIELVDINLLIDLLNKNDIDSIEDYLFANELISSWNDLANAFVIEKKNKFEDELFSSRLSEIKMELDYYISQINVEKSETEKLKL